MPEDPKVQDPKVQDPGNTGPKMVPESDLVALRLSLNSKVDELTNANAKLTTDLNTERAAKTAAEAEVEELTPASNELATAKSELATAQVERQTAQTRLLELRRTSLTTLHKVDADKLKEMDEGQLAALESVLPAVVAAKPGVPNDPNVADLDVKGGAAGSNGANLSARDMMTQGFEQAKPSS